MQPPIRSSWTTLSVDLTSPCCQTTYKNAPFVVLEYWRGVRTNTLVKSNAEHLKRLERIWESSLPTHILRKASASSRILYRHLVRTAAIISLTCSLNSIRIESRTFDWMHIDCSAGRTKVHPRSLLNSQLPKSASRHALGVQLACHRVVSESVVCTVRKKTAFVVRG